ncbi:uncharacterized protein LOC126188179 [Schistocerca cancellata]|uniref:uncharacterized protein LOC126188179 n=1 Tax=Schistocerca cancellata TaxID=274614 RepID=UPI002117D88D|nr:uncharacterized protein LOC126188179 [Schistocerca cancellata]
MAARRVRAPGMWSPLLVLLVVLAAVAAAAAAGGERVPRAAFGTAVGATRLRQNQTHTTPRPEPKSKPCSKDSDCETIRNTTCRVDSDGHRRCLCVDKAPPDNGRCPKPRYFGLRWACSEDRECLPFGECTTPNNTESNSSSGRVCLCKPGHPETDDEECSGSDLRGGSLQLVALAGVAAFTLAAAF